MWTQKPTTHSVLNIKAKELQLKPQAAQREEAQWWKDSIEILVGGFNPSEKLLVKMGIFLK